MGGYFTKMLRDAEDRVVIHELVDLLDRVIKNRRMNVFRYNDEVQRAEMMLDKVRTNSTLVPWDAIVQRAASLSEPCMSETFQKIIMEWIEQDQDVRVWHLLSLYTLFVDVTVHRLMNSVCVNVLNELRSVHRVIYRTLGSSLLRQVFYILKMKV